MGELNAGTRNFPLRRLRRFPASLRAGVLALACAGSAAGETFSLFPGEDPAAAWESQTPGFSLKASLVAAEPADLRAAADVAAAAVVAASQDLAGTAAPPPPPEHTAAVLLTAGVLMGSAATAVSGEIRNGFVPFHFTQEFWFGQHTYAGGADKASHFVLYNGLTRELQNFYGRMNYEEAAATRMAFATSLAGGLITEFGNGLGEGTGFSYEDLVMDALGSATAIYITKHGLNDVVGFRFGMVPAPRPTPCCPVDELGKDYSEEIYTADLKLAGFAGRLRVNPGLARYLLVSFAYGSKGYKYSYAEYREQQVGFEIGLNFPEILRTIGVRDTTWWGRGLFILFNFFRVPYTQIGYHYDVIHGKWYGPNIGEQFDPGPGVTGNAAPTRGHRR